MIDIFCPMAFIVAVDVFFPLMMFAVEFRCVTFHLDASHRTFYVHTQRFVGQCEQDNRRVEKAAAAAGR